MESAAAEFDRNADDLERFGAADEGFRELPTPCSERRPRPMVAGADELISAAEWETVVRLYRLTPGQRRVASMVCAGYSQAAMARSTGLSINTVRVHLRGLFSRLDTHDRVGVVVRCLSARQVAAEDSGGGTG